MNQQDTMKPQIHLKDFHKIFPYEVANYPFREVPHTIKHIIMDFDKEYIKNPKTILFRRRRHDWKQYLFTPDYKDENAEP